MANEVFDRISKNRTLVNIPLTNISTAYLQDMTGGATSFFPVVPVSLSTGTYYNFSKADLLRDDVQRKPILGRTDPVVVSYDSSEYRCMPEQIILGYDDISQSDLTRIGAPGMLDIRQNKSRVIAQKIFIHQNKAFAKSYFKAGVWGTDLTGGTDFTAFDDDSSDPIGVISGEITKMLESTGRRPNKLGMGQRVYDALVTHPDILNRVIYGGTSVNPARVTKEALAMVLGVDEIVVFNSIWNSAALGESESMEFICDKNSMLLAYATNTPMIDEATAGYTFSWDMGLGATLPIIEWEGAPGTYSHYIGGMVSQDMEVVCKDLGVYFSNAVTPEE